MKEIFTDDYYNHKKIQSLYNCMIRSDYICDEEKITVNQYIRKYNLNENEIKEVFEGKLNQLRYKFDEDIDIMVDKLYKYHCHKYECLLPRISYLGEFQIPILVINVTHLKEEVLNQYIIDEKTNEEVLLKEYLNTPKLSIEKRINKIEAAIDAVLNIVLEESYNQEEKEFLISFYDLNSISKIIKKVV